MTGLNLSEVLELAGLPCALAVEVRQARPTRPAPDRTLGTR